MLHAARENLLLPVDLVHAPTGTVIEVDGAGALHLVPPHPLDLYPADVGGRLRPRRVPRSSATRARAAGDRLARGLPAKGFGFGGVQRERAYHDALLDLATPAMGHPPVVRIAAPDGDGAAAYARHRDALPTLSRVLSRVGGAARDSSVIATLTVLQPAALHAHASSSCTPRPWTAASTLPHCTHT